LADDARRSLEAGRIIPSTYPDTIADGLRTSLGKLAFEVLSEKLEAIVTVDEGAIATAMRTIWERMKIVIEPSAAVAFAAVQAGAVDVAGKKVGIVLSGGNVDLEALPWLDS
jgi:threonine dehydratase